MDRKKYSRAVKMTELNSYTGISKEFYLEGKDYREIIQKYDSLNTLFYLATPYDEYKMTDEDYKIMYNMVESVEGLFIIYVRKTAFMMKLFEDFFIEECKTTGMDGRNLLIRNFMLF